MADSSVAVEFGGLMKVVAGLVEAAVAADGSARRTALAEGLA